jgi:hypothetical protein
MLGVSIKNSSAGERPFVLIGAYQINGIEAIGILE